MMVGWAPLAEDLSILPGRLPVVQPADHVGFYLGSYAKAVQIAGSSYSVAKQGTDEYLGYQHHAVAAAPGSHLPVPSGDPSQAGFSVDIVHNGPPGRTGPALAPSAANLPVPYVAFRVNGATIATTSPTRPANPVDGMVVLDRRLGCLIWWDATKKRWRRTGNGVAV
ncbi:MAG: hypothetical protein LKG20_12175 [Tetrasphaera jenkinsii]|jgi:hypothetical protein|nr:hypothetical protein [Tetrasphaera jenkinsii]